MIKGLLKKLCIFGLIALPSLFINFSSADNTWYDRDVSALGYSPVDSDLNIAVSVKGQLLTNSNGISKNMLFLQDSSDYKTLFFWTKQGLPYAYIYVNSIHSAFQGVPNYYWLCNTGFNRDNTPCTGYDLTLSSVGLFSDFLSKVNNSDVWSFIAYGNFFRICISSEIYGKSLCFGYSSYNGDGCSHLACYKNSVLTGYSLDIDAGITFDNFPTSVLGQSPGVSGNVPIQTGPGIDDYTYISIGSGDVVDYFESQRNYNINLCYVGTRDLSGNYEDRLTYYEGTGYTIFDAYSKLYNKSSFKLSEVGTFLNVQFVNFGSWFMGRNRDLSGNVIYNMIDNFDGTTSLDYGPGLTNPFLGNKAVFYFIGSTVWDSHIDEPDGERLAYYCYNRLTSYTNISGSTGYNIQDDHNKAYDEWVAVYKRNSSNYNNQFSGSDIIVSQSWDGTPLDYFNVESEGDDIEDLDFLGYFNKSFTRFKSVFEGLDISDLSVGQLPTYIVAFLLAIIFFRFLRK